MILPREDIAWIRADDERLETFDPHRLASSIARAAETAGQLDWDLAESIAVAIQIYLVQAGHAPATPAAEIARLVESVLRMLGHEAIARAYSQRQHHAEIRLDHIAERAGYELEFFHELDRLLGAAAAQQTAVLQFRGLRQCVKSLRRARRWGRSCGALAEQILDHIRSRVSRWHHGPPPLALRVAVTD
jgi:hypothetical protein